MFELSIKKSDLLVPLLTVAGALDKKQSLAILSNFLFILKENQVEISATDLEIQITARVPCESQDKATITIPAKKFIDIMRSLEEEAKPIFLFKEGSLNIKHQRSSFKLGTLAADTYPSAEDECHDIELKLPRQALLYLLESTHFAMSQQDVRFFLNGILLEFEGNAIVAVGSDGHRLAISRYSCTHDYTQKILLPRKGVQEILRILNAINEENILVAVGKNHFTLITEAYTFSSKLIDARFPPYAKAIPKNQDKSIVVDAGLLKRSLSRIIILANEKSKAVLLHMQANQITLIANNQEQEEAIETLEAETEGDEIKIGLNASYLIDVLNHFSEGKIRLSLSTTDSSILVESLSDENYQYILMPMKL